MTSEPITSDRASRAVQFALSLGEQLQISGGEVSRVEDTISRICRAFGATRVDVFAITSVVFVTAIFDGGVVITQSRRIHGISKNTARLEALNALSREVCADPGDLDAAEGRLSSILRIKPIGKLRFWLASLLATVSFTAFFGGDLLDVLATLIAASVIVLCEFVSEYVGGNRILSNVLSCFLCSVTAIVLVSFGIGSSLNMIMSGCIMILIPGISMTSAVENLIMGDTLSGLLGVLEAAITALALAGGFALSQWLMGGAFL